MVGKWPYSCCFVECCYSKQHAVCLYSSHPAFSPSVTFKSKCCNHTVVLMQLGRILTFFYQRPVFHTVINLSVAVHALPMQMLTSLSVDEILLLRYINWFINFRGLPFNSEMIPSWLKQNSFQDQCLLLHCAFNKFPDLLYRHLKLS